jgi:hypothetical protein
MQSGGEKVSACTGRNDTVNIGPVALECGADKGSKDAALRGRRYERRGKQEMTGRWISLVLRGFW